MKLVDHINSILASSIRARFAVGYFFLSGLTSIAHSLAHVKELRLLIGNVSGYQTVEQLAEAYRSLDMVTDTVDLQNYPKRIEVQRMAAETAYDLRNVIELMDQTDDAEAMLNTLVQMIRAKRLKVRVYTKGRLRRRTSSTMGLCLTAMGIHWIDTKRGSR